MQNETYIRNLVKRLGNMWHSPPPPCTHLSVWCLPPTWDLCGGRGTWHCEDIEESLPEAVTALRSFILPREMRDFRDTDIQNREEGTRTLLPRGTRVVVENWCRGRNQTIVGHVGFAKTLYSVLLAEEALGASPTMMVSYPFGTVKGQ